MYKKKPILFILAALISINIFATNAFASVEITKPTDNEITVKSEQKRWFYRYYNGKYQKRLWSMTEAEWLTDWIDCRTE